MDRQTLCSQIHWRQTKVRFNKQQSVARVSPGIQRISCFLQNPVDVWNASFLHVFASDNGGNSAALLKRGVINKLLCIRAFETGELRQANQRLILTCNGTSLTDCIV